MLHIKFGFGWPSGFREEDLSDGRMPDHGHPISSPCEPNGSGELKNIKNFLLKFYNFYNLKNLCTLYGRVFVM